MPIPLVIFPVPAAEMTEMLTSCFDGVADFDLNQVCQLQGHA